jgi:hypothetical protein
VLEPEKPVSPADVDEQLNRLNAELDSQGNATAPATSLVNKAMEVSVHMDQAHGGQGGECQCLQPACDGVAQLNSQDHANAAGAARWQHPVAAGSLANTALKVWVDMVLGSTGQGGSTVHKCLQAGWVGRGVLTWTVRATPHAVNSLKPQCHSPLHTCHFFGVAGHFPADHYNKASSQQCG